MRFAGSPAQRQVSALSQPLIEPPGAATRVVVVVSVSPPTRALKEIVSGAASPQLLDAISDKIAVLGRS